MEEKENPLWEFEPNLVFTQGHHLKLYHQSSAKKASSREFNLKDS